MTKWIHGALHAWLGLLVLGGCLRTLNGLLFFAMGTGPLGLLIGPLDLITLLVMTVLWLGALVTPRVPLRVFMPGWIMVIWMSLGALPLSVLLYNTAWFQLSLGALLLASAGLSWGLGRGLGGEGPTISIDALAERPEYRWSRTVGWLAANLSIVPSAVVLYLVLGMAWALHWGTYGFMTLTPAGLAATHKTYTNGADTAHLIGMVHIGDEDAYRQLFAELPAGDGTLILAEGVQDSDKLMSSPVNAYDQAAKRIGLSAQKPMSQLTDLTVRNADVDVNTFDPLTVELLNVVLGIYGSGEDRNEAIDAYMSFWLEHSADQNQVVEQLFEDILYSRNVKLLNEIDAARSEVDHIVVPWGALHLREVAQEMESDGWTQQTQRKVVLIPFWG